MAPSTLDLTRDWLKSVLRPYPSRDIIQAEVLRVLQRIPSLAVKTDAFTFDSGATALLLLLHGTLPITYRGASYHIPVHIWFPHEYPRTPPMVFVVPTKDMGVRKGREVEPGGKVRDEVLADVWAQSRTRDLDTLLAWLTDVFSAVPPVYAKPPEQKGPARSGSTSSASGSGVGVTPGAVGGAGGSVGAGPGGAGAGAGGAGPSLPARPHQNGEALPGYHSPPPPTIPGYVPSPSRQSSLSHASPMQPHSPHSAPQPTSQPHPNHPPQSTSQPLTPPPASQSPPVPLRPGQQPPLPSRPVIPPPMLGMAPLPLSPSGTGTSGGWQPQPQPQASVYAHAQSFQQQPQQQQQHPHQPRYSPPQQGQQAHPPQQPPPPQQYPPQQQQQFGQHPYAPQQLPPQQLQHGYQSPPPVATGQAPYVPQPQAGYAAHPGQPAQVWSAGGGPPSSAAASAPAPGPGPSTLAPPASRPVDLLSSPDPTTAELPDAPPPLPPSKPPPPSLVHLHTILLPHLTSALPPLMQNLGDTKSHLVERREDLASGEPAIRDEMARLEAVKKVCDAVGARLGDVVAKGSERVADLENRGDVSVDEVVCSISIVHNQLIDLVAEDNAISDTIYHVTRALDAERIDLQQCLKAVRSLAREQYMKRALIERINDGMGGNAWRVSS